MDAYLMGRVLYQEWAAYWPEHADEPFGDGMARLFLPDGPPARLELLSSEAFKTGVVSLAYAPAT